VSEVAARLAVIRERIAAAAARSGRPPSRVRLVGASKLQPLEKLVEAWEAGLRIFGENRVQEALEKSARFPYEGNWNLLGPLQSNKVGAALDLFSVFHAIDRPKIARALDQEASRRGLIIIGFLEVNLGDEPTKHGFSPATIADEVEPLAALTNLKIAGLMTIPPPTSDKQEARPWFRSLRLLRDELEARPEWHGRLTELSMGMSQDYEIAIQEGATYVRIGSALFGPRPAEP